MTRRAASNAHRKCISVSASLRAHISQLCPSPFICSPCLKLMQCRSPQNGGGGNKMHCEEGAGWRSRDPCNAARIPMWHKVPRQKIQKEQSAERDVFGKHNTDPHTKTSFPKLTERRESRKGKTPAKRDPLGRRPADRSLDETLGPVPFRSAKHAV